MRLLQPSYHVTPYGYAERNTHMGWHPEARLESPKNRGTWGVVIRDYWTNAEHPLVLRAFDPMLGVCQEQMVLVALVKALDRIYDHSQQRRSSIELNIFNTTVHGWLTGTHACRTCPELLQQVKRLLAMHDVTLLKTSNPEGDVRYAKNLAAKCMRDRKKTR